MSPCPVFRQQLASSTNSFGAPAPVFRVKDMDASIAYYRDALGFELRWRAGDGFTYVARERCSIFLTDDNQSQPRMWVWIGVQDARALHTRRRVWRKGPEPA